MQRHLSEDRDAPLIRALEALDPDPFVVAAVYRLFVEAPRLLARGVLADLHRADARHLGAPADDAEASHRGVGA